MHEICIDINKKVRISRRGVLQEGAILMRLIREAGANADEIPVLPGHVIRVVLSQCV